MVTDKLCKRCNKILPVASFHKATRSKDGLQVWCSLCRKNHKYEERRQYHRERYHTKKDNYLNSTYKRKYGIGLETYEKLLNAQEGVCAICKKLCSSGRRLAVDHSHKTGEVRGLLCGCCNRALGYVQEDKTIVSSLFQYLEKHENQLERQVPTT